MVFCFLCKPSSPSSSFKNIRVVRLNGYVEEFDNPVTVSEVTGNPMKDFVFTHAQLLSAGSKHLKPDYVLEPGNVYFLIPYSIFQSSVSSVDLVPIARKLSAIAKKGNSRCKAKATKSRKKSSSVKFEKCSGINRYSAGREAVVSVRCNMQGSRKLQPWKPILSTIREFSFTRRSESDLRELSARRD